MGTRPLCVYVAYTKWKTAIGTNAPELSASNITIAVDAAISTQSVTAMSVFDCNHHHHRKEGQHVQFLETCAIINTLLGIVKSNLKRF